MRKALIWAGVVLVALAAIVILKYAPGTSNIIWSISDAGRWLLPLVGVSALLDSVHPCSFSILLITIAFLFGMQMTRGKILAIGGIYIAGIFVAYTINDRKIPKLTLGMMIIVGAIFYILTSFIGRSMVFGPGMEPSYKDREGIWVDRFTVEFNKPKRGDVVLVQNSSGGDSIKRVIGLPGEEIKLLGSMVVINGDSVLVEPYVKTTERCAMGVSFINPYVSTYKLDSYEYLVLSDNNRLELQPPTVVSQTNIIGRVLGQKGQPTITKLSPTGLKEYNNPELKISFQYSSGCLVESKEKNKITVKEVLNQIQSSTFLLTVETSEEFL